MQTKLYTLAMLLLFSLNLMAASPTDPATNITFNTIDGGSVRVNWSNGNGQRRIVIARQLLAVTATPSDGVDYLADADFGSGQEIAPGQFVVYDGTGTHANIDNLQPNTLYFFAVYEYNGTGAATEYIASAPSGSVSTLSAPTNQASAVVFSNVTGNSMKISWTNGNGSKRLVLARAGGPVSANPSDLVNYSASPTFENGSQIGAGNYVVYFSTSNSVTLTSLQPNTVYHFAIFESNGASEPVFLTAGSPIASQLTLPRPSVASSNISFSAIDGASMKLSWNQGNGSRRIVVAREGSPVDAVPVDGVDYMPAFNTSMPFTTATEITPGQKVVYESTGASVDVTGLNPNTTYYFKIFEYDGSNATIVYLTSLTTSASHATVTAPTTQASNIVFSNITGNSMKLTWTNGNGQKRVVVGKAGGPVDAAPVDLTNYSGNLNFGQGTQLGSGNYILYASTSNTITINNLSLNQTYHFAVFEANGNSTPVYNISSPATGSQATTDRPTSASGNISFSELEGNEMKLTWASGNGQRRIIVVRENAPVTAVPADGVDYLTPTTSSFATAPEILPGEKVVYDNTSNQAVISGLTTGNTYHYRIYEYSGTGSNIAYLTGSFASASKATLVAPVVAASNISFSGITGNSLSLSWTNGDGSRRIILARKGAAVDATPSNYTAYASSPQFGSGSQLGTGNYVVFLGSGSTATITGLELNTVYHFAIFEYNGTDGPVYLTSLPATASQATADRPTIAPSNVNFSLLDGNAMRVTWNIGNGQKRLVVARAGSPVDAIPADGLDYLASSTSSWPSAPEIAPGQKVIYDNNGTFIDLTGLSPNTTYHFRVYEYSGTGTGIAYLTSSYAVGSKSTLTHPTVQASTVAFTSVAATGMVVSWTLGDGSNRLVIARQGAPVDVSPTDLVEYTSNTNFGNGSQIGSGNYVVAKTNSTSVTINGLLPGTTYHFAVFEFNGADGPLYLRPGATGQATTIGPPSVAASSPFVTNSGTNSLQINWTNGSGNKRLVLMKKDVPVDAAPANNVNYFGNSFFGSGTEIGSGNFVVFNGIQDFVTVTNLIPGTVYHFTIFEYNDFGSSSSQFLLSSTASGSSATGVLPVSFIEFRGTVRQGKVLLQWATAQEENSAYFEVQRSSNGTDYTAIGRVNAAGSSDTRRDYSFTDAGSLDGAQYYRVMEMDSDGSRQYTQVVRIQISKAAMLKYLVNPVTNQLKGELNGQPEAGSHIAVYDMTGRLVKHAALATSAFKLDITNLTKGIYVAEIVTQAGTEKIKIVKQ